MKVVDRETFLKCPEGTIYCKGGEWYFDQLHVKGETWNNDTGIGLGDWVYLNPSWPAGKNSEECFNILENSLKTRESFKGDQDWGRDGSFDPDDLFLIYELDDLQKLEKLIREAQDACVQS